MAVAGEGVGEGGDLGVVAGGLEPGFGEGGGGDVHEAFVAQVDGVLVGDLYAFKG